MKLYWMIKSLRPLAKERAVFSILLDEILSVSPQLRDLAYHQIRLIEFIKECLSVETFNQEKVSKINLKF